MSTDVSLILNASFNVPGNSACHDAILKADLSKGPKDDDKPSYCLYCGKFQTKLPRHLALKHLKEKERKFLIFSNYQEVHKEM